MKQINLSDSKVVGVHINIKNNTIRNIIVEGEVLDDSGNVVTTENLILLFNNLPVQEQQSVNKVMKALSKLYSKIKIHEDKETWEDSK